MENLEKLVETISKESGKPAEEVRRLVEEKKEELSGLVSGEGAAYIVGRELGVSLLNEGKRQLKVRNLMEGLSGIELVARILNVSEVREWEKQGKKGRVQSLILGDDTGTVRMPLWNEEIDMFSQLQLGEDDVIALSGVWVKLDNRGSPELRLGKGRIQRSKEEVVPPKEEIRMVSELRRAEISGLKEGDFAEVRACLVQIYRRDPFFQTCPECSARVFEQDGKPRCKEHGIVKPQDAMVISGVLDGGSGNIRAVFFRELGEKLWGEKAKGLKQLAKKKGDLLSIFDDFKGMGKDFIVSGRVKKSEFTGSLELIANDIREMDVKKEAERLLAELNGSQ